jgi:Tfp pilus assembly protein PilF
MLRYQFGPFLAYFNTNRTEDLKALAEYALQRTPSSEEGHLWMGWALYREGDAPGAREHFRAALENHPGYSDATYALDFVGW